MANSINSASVSIDIYHTIFKYFSDGIIGISERGTIQIINPAAEVIFDYLAKEIVGEDFSILLSAPDHPEQMTSFNRYYTGPSRKVMGQKKDGAIFPMELTVTEASDNNEIIYLASIRDLPNNIDSNSLQKTEENLRQSQEYAGVAHWRYDLLTKQLICSENFKQVYGLHKYHDNNFYVETLFTYTHPDDKDLLSDSFTRCLAGINQDKIEVEYRITTVDGSLQWMQLKGGVEKNNKGQAVFIHGIAQNITKRKKAESRGVALGEIIDKAQIEIYIINMTTFKFIEVNKLARDNLGYSLNELQELTPLDIKRQLKATDFHQIITPLFIGEQENVIFQAEHYRKDGSTYPVEVKLQFMAFSGKDVYIAFIEDITNRLNTLKALNEANHAKSLFLSRISHEFRTPLNAINGFSQLMELDEKAPLTLDQSENVNEIFKAGNHLLNLINEIQDLSKIEAGQVSISSEPMKINEIFLTVQRLIEPIALKHGITLINEVNATFCLLSDPTRCKQILINLISNAIKYNKKNGHVTLKTNLSKDKQFLQIKVEDTGNGLTEQQIKNIFIPFERLGAEATNIEGTGIGLTLSKELVELMGGEIGVSSQLGKGSCFWFTLPLIQEACCSCWKINKEETEILESSPDILYSRHNLKFG